MNTAEGRQEPGSRAITVLAYVVLFVLGALQGLVGSFQYGQSPAPLVAIVFVVAIFATCALGGWAMRSRIGALLPAAGWLLASLVLSTGNAQGSVIITATTAGEWYLYGGAAGSLAGVGTAIFRSAYARR